MINDEYMLRLIERIEEMEIDIIELKKWKDKSWKMHQEMAQEILPNQIELLEEKINKLEDDS